MNLRVLLSYSLVAALFFSTSAPACAQDKGLEAPIQQLVGEDYRYSLDFLFFTGLAEGELRFEKTDQPNIYRAELVGRTLGVASWLAGDRTQTYTSLMELKPDGSLRSIEHTAKITKHRWGKWLHWGRYHRYDYEKGTITVVKSKEGVLLFGKEIAISEGQQPVDMLTAFYNLRTGVYGPLVRGSRLLIPTYSGKGFNEIEVNVLTVDQQSEKVYFPSHGLLMLIKVDPVIFDTKSGQLYVWFDGTGVPERGVVEDLIGLGDVFGSLSKEKP
jgi:hypothetical protein